MEKVIVYNLEEFLPLYKMERNKVYLMQSGKEVEICSYETSINKELEEIEKTNLHDDNQSNNQDSCPEWVKQLMELGLWGELLALEYLKQDNNSIKHVSSIDSSLGYDIETKNKLGDRFVYEVKTSSAKDNKFFISYNELKIASVMKKQYNIFYIHVDKLQQQVTGCIINDPVGTFNISFHELTKIIELNNIFIAPSNYIIQLKPNFFEELDSINLSSYAKLLISQQF